MIAFPNHKIAVLLNPRTGTASLTKVLMEIPGAIKTKSQHASFQQGKEWLPEITDWSDYTMYCFYRDPIDRWLSFAHYRTRVTKYDVGDIMGLPRFPVRLQTRFLVDSEKEIKLLDFENYENEVRKLTNLLDYTIPYDIPKHHTSINRDDVSVFNEETLSVFKIAYKEDYEFFASKDIKVKSA